MHVLQEDGKTKKIPIKEDLDLTRALLLRRQANSGMIYIIFSCTIMLFIYFKIYFFMCVVLQAFCRDCI